MSRQPKRIPKYRNRKSDGRAVVTLDGREIYLGKYGTDESRRKYEQLIAEWLANDRRLPARQRSATISVVELCAGYWTHAQGHYRRPDGSTTSRIAIVKPVLRRLKELYGPVLVTACSDEDETCDQYSKCNVRDPLWRLKDRIVQSLASFTLKELAEDDHRSTFPVTVRPGYAESVAVPMRSVD